MTVPVALKELKKMGMLKQSNGKYVLDYAIIATRSKILDVLPLLQTRFLLV